MSSLVPVDAAGFAPFSALLEKCKAARPLTPAEKIENADALTPGGVATLCNEVDEAYDRGVAANVGNVPLTKNPYSNDDNPLGWEAWNEGWNDAAAGLDV